MPFFLARIAVGVFESLGRSPGSVMAYRFSGKIPVALNPDMIARGVIAWFHAIDRSFENWYIVTTLPGLEDMY